MAPRADRLRSARRLVSPSACACQAERNPRTAEATATAVVQLAWHPTGQDAKSPRESLLLLL
jgi:hypothetical protein